jgi:general secretion pathway protein E
MGGEAPPPLLYRGKGCRECQGTGFRGRTGIFETMEVTTTIRSLILERASANVVRRTATQQGMKSLREDGWRLMRTGRTTLEEILRVTKDERALGNGEPSPAAEPGAPSTLPAEAED